MGRLSHRTKEALTRTRINRNHHQRIKHTGKEKYLSTDSCLYCKSIFYRLQEGTRSHGEDERTALCQCHRRSIAVRHRIKTKGGQEAIPTLFKITVDGQTQQVNFTDNEGQQVPVKTNYVLNLSEKFLMINLGVYIPNIWQSYVFIVRKTDGVMFSPGYTGYNDASQTIFSQYSYRLEEGENIYDFIERLPEMDVDKDNNVYHNDYLHKTLYKIHDDAWGNMFATGLNSPTTLPSYGAYVNKNGDAWFTSSKLCRLTSGELIRTPDASSYYFYPFLLPSQDHNFYRLDYFSS